MWPYMVHVCSTFGGIIALVSVYMWECMYCKYGLMITCVLSCSWTRIFSCFGVCNARVGVYSIRLFVCLHVREYMKTCWRLCCTWGDIKCTCGRVRCTWQVMALDACVGVASAQVMECLTPVWSCTPLHVTLTASVGAWDRCAAELHVCGGTRTARRV